MTVSATVLVVAHLAPAVLHTTTHLTLDPRWNPRTPTTHRPHPPSPLLNSSISPQTLPMVLLAKAPVAAMVVWHLSVRYHVPTVGRRRHPFGAVTTSATIFATLVVRRLSLFFKHPRRRYRLSAAMMRWHVLMGRRSNLSYHGPFLITHLFYLVWGYLTVILIHPFRASSINEIKPHLPYTCRSILQASRDT